MEPLTEQYWTHDKSDLLYRVTGRSKFSDDGALDGAEIVHYFRDPFHYSTPLKRFLKKFTYLCDVREPGGREGNDCTCSHVLQCPIHSKQHNGE